MNIEIPPFYVGQEIVAIRNHSQFLYKKGDEFIVLSIRKGCCQWEIQVGVKCVYDLWECSRCGRIENSHNYCFFGAGGFSPKIEIKEFISLAQLSEQTLENISAN